MDPSAMFDAYYYAHGCGLPYERSAAWLGAVDRYAERICAAIAPRTALDAGCAMGLLVEALRRRDVEAWGIDISEYAIQNVAPEMRPFCRLASVTEPLERDYDLILAIEVFEHMSQPDAEAGIANLCRHTNDILFSSTPFDYKEATHLNVKPPEYWGELFARQGFFRDVDFDGSFLTPWTVRFRRRSEPFSRLAGDYERKFWLLWKENTDLRSLSLSMRNDLSVQEAELNRQKLLADKQVTALDEASRNLAALQQQVTEMQNSRTWRWGQKLSRLGAGRLFSLIRRLGNK